ncbi:MAG TPA: hypothetical protein VFB32_05220 [Rudaea sp.]|nr:hypothetical protein [Rudaea sp.]
MLRSICVAGLAGLAAMTAAHAERVLTGTTPSGAYYRIAVPDNWHNGGALVLFQHGLTFEPPGPNPDLGPIANLQLSEGYAVAASSYSQRSWALFDAPNDNAELLAVFRQQVGSPGAIIPYGGSLGGLVALKLAEDPRFAPVPGVYAACPPAAGSRVWDQGFDLRLAYDVVCKGAGDLPTGDQPYPWAYNLGDIPPNLSDLEDEAQLLETLIPLNQCTGVNLPDWLRNGAMDRRLSQLMNLSHITDEHFFIVNAGYATYGLSDLVRAPDKMNDLNPFTNIGVDYGDATINANIARVAADPFATLYFRWASDFRGRIAPTTKVLSIQTSQDQLVIPANQYVLRQTLPASQLTSALVAETSPTHCGFTSAEGVAGWEALRTWMATGTQPSVDDVQAECNAATAAGAAGPCRYDASIAVPTFDSLVRPRPAASALVVDGTFSGEWYDPARNGEGIALEILPQNKAVLYFFTYPPAGSAGTQAWLTAVGDVVGNGVEFADVQLPARGADGTVTGTHWGRIGITFSDCNTGAMRWDGPAEWGSMEVPLSRITVLEGLGCGAQGTPSAAAASGDWYDPAHLGTGFIFEQIDAATIATMWFGFDAAGNPVWLNGVLAAAEDGTFGGTLAQGQGPSFGAAYDAGKFHLVTDGSLLELRLGCTSGSAQFAAAAGEPAYLSSPLALQRITTLAGVPACSP